MSSPARGCAIGLVLAALIWVVLLGCIWLIVSNVYPSPAKGDQPFVSYVIPQSEFVPVVPPLQDAGTNVVVANPRRPREVTIAPSAAPIQSEKPVRSQARLPTAGKATAEPAVIVKAAEPESMTGQSLSGQATWYAYVPGGAAAGPRLRAALGSGWRGRTVTVWAAGRHVTVALSDWCACSPSTRLVDLDVRAFAALMDPGMGVIPVNVMW